MAELDQVHLLNQVLHSFLHHFSSTHYLLVKTHFSDHLQPQNINNNNKNNISLDSTSTSFINRPRPQYELTPVVLQHLASCIPLPILNAAFPFLDSHFLLLIQHHPPSFLSSSFSSGSTTTTTTSSSSTTSLVSENKELPSFPALSTQPPPSLILLAPGILPPRYLDNHSIIWTDIDSLKSYLQPCFYPPSSSSSSSSSSSTAAITQLDPFFDTSYAFLSNGLYCPCSIFQSMVLHTASSFLCPHILAYHLLSYCQPSSIIKVSHECWKDLCFEYLCNGTLLD